MKNRILNVGIIVVSILLGLLGGSAVTEKISGETPVQMISRWREEDAAKGQGQDSSQEEDQSPAEPVDDTKGSESDAQEPGKNIEAGTNSEESLQADADLSESKGVLLGNTQVEFELHPVMSGIGNNYLFDIAVGRTKKSVIESVSSEELTEFINAIDFSGTNGNAVLMFEDGTGMQIMQSSKTYTADYGYVDVSNGEFTMTERLGAIWNDTGGGWYYKTVDEMRDADIDKEEINSVKPVETQKSPASTPKSSADNTQNADVQRPSNGDGQSSSQPESAGEAKGSVNAQNPVDTAEPPASSGNKATIKNSDGTYTHDFSNGRVLGTKNSDKYHNSDCIGARKIPPENEVWYKSVSDAVADGREPCGNCYR